MTKTGRALLVSLLLIISQAQAAEYTVDPAHSYIAFRIQHLGFSWLRGQFRDFEGRFYYEAAKPGKSRIDVEISAASLDTNHAERDRHLRSAAFLDVGTHQQIRFESTRFSGTATRGFLEGRLSLHGVSRPVRFEVIKIGEGKDPWGGYRVGFHARYSLKRSDFGMHYNLGKFGDTVEIELGIEGVRN